MRILFFFPLSVSVFRSSARRCQRDRARPPKSVFQAPRVSCRGCNADVCDPPLPRTPIALPPSPPHHAPARPEHTPSAAVEIRRPLVAQLSCLILCGPRAPTGRPCRMIPNAAAAFLAEDACVQVRSGQAHLPEKVISLTAAHRPFRAAGPWDDVALKERRAVPLGFRRPARPPFGVKTRSVARSRRQARGQALDVIDSGSPHRLYGIIQDGVRDLPPSATVTPPEELSYPYVRPGRGPKLRTEPMTIYSKKARRAKSRNRDWGPPSAPRWRLIPPNEIIPITLRQ